MVIGEGAGVLVVEDLEHARRRGARIYAEVVGFGAAFDRQAHGAGLARAIRAALHEAGIGPEDIDHVNAHGLGTRRSATPGKPRGIAEVFGTATPRAGVRRQELHRQPRRRQRHDRAGRQPAALQHGTLPRDAELRRARPGLPGAVHRGSRGRCRKPYFAEGRLHRHGPVRRRRRAASGTR